MCHDVVMRVDHVVYAAEHDGVMATAMRLGKLIGVHPVDGGNHPRFGTRNVILPLRHDRYVEVVEVLDHPASYKAPFGQAVRIRSEAGGGWLGWVIAVDDIDEQERRVGRDAVDGNRTRPDGTQLHWRQLGVKGLIADPQLPFYIQWGDHTEHPSHSGETRTRIRELQIAGDPERIRDWLGVPTESVSPSIYLAFTAPHGTPGLLSVAFQTPEGRVTI